MTSAAPASSVHPTNLAFLHQEILTLIVRVRSGRQKVSDPKYFRGQIQEALKTAREQALNSGYSEESVHATQFALVAFVDATIVELGSSVMDEWVRRPLLEELFNIQTGRSIFFQNLERLMGEPDSGPLADTLEVYMLCLLLGYAGKRNPSGAEEVSGLSESGLRESGLRKSAMDRLRRIRPYTPELSPAWRPPVETGAALAAGVNPKRLSIAAVSGSLALALIFVAYKVALASSVSGLSAIAVLRGGGP